MNKDITITISGTTNSGKSRLTYFLKEFLKKEGFDVDLKSIDFQNENHFDKNMNENIDQIIDDFKKTKKIKIVEKQLKRNYCEENSF